MTWVLLCLWFASAAVLGYLLASLALTGESLRAVFVTYGIVSGHVIQGLVLVLLWGPMPISRAFEVTVALSFAASCALALRKRRQQSHPGLHWGIPLVETALVVVLLGLYAVVGHQFFTVGYRSFDPEVLFFHSAVVEEMTKQTYPIVNPLEPDDPLRYRFGFHVLAAAIRSHSDDLPPEIMASVIAALMPLLVIALVGASIRFLGSARPGMIAAILGLFGGSALPWRGPFELVLPERTVVVQHTALVSGLLWHGNTLDMIHVSPTIAAGFVAFAIALWLCSEALERPAFSRLAIATCALAYLGLVNEVHFAVLAAALGIVAALDALSGSRRTFTAIFGRMLPALGLLAAAYLLVTVRGGLSGGIAIFGSSQDSLQIVLNLDHFGQVPGPPNAPWEYWISLLSPEAIWDTDGLIFVLPILLVVVTLKQGDGLSRRGVVAAAVSLAVWVFTYSARRPADSYRLGQAALTIYLAMLPFVLAPLWRFVVEKGHQARLASYLLAVPITVLVVFFTLPHLLLATVWTLSPPPVARAFPDGPDGQASAYLRQNPEPGRVLVPFDKPDADIWELYADTGPGAAATDLLALSGRAIPMGHHAFSNPQKYLPTYRRAGLTFDPESLAALQIGWVYVLPYYLGSQQEQNLTAAVQRGDLQIRERFGTAGTESERWLFRVCIPPGDAG